MKKKELIERIAKEAGVPRARPRMFPPSALATPQRGSLKLGSLDFLDRGGDEAGTLPGAHLHGESLPP